MKIYSLKQIETPRLLIRPLKLGDEIEINQAINRSLEILQRWMPWAEDPSLETTKDFVYRNVNAWKCGQSKEFPLVAVLKAENKIVSATGYNDRSELTRPYFEIGYWIDSNYQGRSLVTELVNALTRYALDGLKATRVQLSTQTDNIKSLGVAKRCGFVQEALLKNYCIDCVSNKPADSYLYACCDTSSLPGLEVKFEHHEKFDFEEADNQIKQKSDNPILLPLFETDRLRLTPPTIKSAEEMMQALTASLNEVGQWFTWASPKTTVEHVRQHMKEGMDAAVDINAHQYLFYLVRDKVNDTFLGEVWLKTNELPMVTINYWFDTRQTGQGYATESVRELVRYAFVDLKVRRIQLHAAETNSKSIKLAKRLGFTHEGTMKGASRNFLSDEVVASEIFSMCDLSELRL
jgi:RimJ/RimL family protein N-acetyltransferase